MVAWRSGCGGHLHDSLGLRGLRHPSQLTLPLISSASCRPRAGVARRPMSSESEDDEIPEDYPVRDARDALGGQHAKTCRPSTTSSPLCTILVLLRVHSTFERHPTVERVSACQVYKTQPENPNPCFDAGQVAAPVLPHCGPSTVQSVFTLSQALSSLSSGDHIHSVWRFRPGGRLGGRREAPCAARAQRRRG